MLICNYCNHSFANEKTLRQHQKQAKYCIQLQQKYKCAGCDAVLSREQRLIDHQRICIKYQVNEQLMLKNQEIQLLKEQNAKLEKQLEKALRRPTSVTNIIQNFSPLTQEHMNSYAQYLTIDHVKEGALGYAKYAIDYVRINHVK